ncbi:MAG: UTP--glucose-1-phosphate uridylyltransferase [Xanthomonadales bacterium]|nr:UTP--glucose-1-phosphate uridylyltransferase [Xanthomonadales bacterium]
MRPQVAVFPVAGLGTRILPASKSVPKELLPVLERPLLQYAVEEALATGCRTLVFVLNREKLALVDYFDRSLLLEQRLSAGGKAELLAGLRGLLPADARCLFALQSEPLGLGHAVLCAREAVGGRPFAVLLPDELLLGEPPALEQLARAAERRSAPALAVMEVAETETGRYGIVAGTELDASGLLRIERLVEKPRPEEAPSRLAAVGRYLLDPEIFPLLEGLAPGANGELQLSDAIARLAARREVLALRIEAERYDCGQLPGWLTANLRLALRRPELRPAIEELLRRP